MTDEAQKTFDVKLMAEVERQKAEDASITCVWCAGTFYRGKHYDGHIADHAKNDAVCAALQATVDALQQTRAAVAQRDPEAALATDRALALAAAEGVVPR